MKGTRPVLDELRWQALLEKEEFVEENEDPPNGSLVLARLRGQDVTVKRFYRERSTVRLKWQNGELREMVLPAEEVRGRGREGHHRAGTVGGVMPSDTPLDKEVFGRIRWQGVAAESEKKECQRYSGLFSSRAGEAEEAGDQQAREAFALLGGTASMMLHADSREEPFRPMMVFSTGRSAALEDFTDDHLDALGEVAGEASDPELRARIAERNAAAPLPGLRDPGGVRPGDGGLPRARKGVDEGEMEECWSRDANELEASFRFEVDDYLDWCAWLAAHPERPSPDGS